MQPPQTHGHQIVDADGKGAVDVDHLRKIGHVLRLHPVAVDSARERAQEPGNALEQRRFPRPVRPHHRKQRPCRHQTIQVMNGRMPVIAKRQIAKGERAGHGGSPDRPQQGEPQRRGGDARNQNARPYGLAQNGRKRRRPIKLILMPDHGSESRPLKTAFRLTVM